MMYVVQKTFKMKNIEELKENINAKKEGLKVQIKVCANAKKNSIEFIDDIIKVKIAKPAVDGKANKEIINFFSEILKIPKSNVTIVNGEKSSLKLLLLVPKS